ncbi:phenylalanine--tRNA ligase beta subunit, cytoplasmic-like [Rhododendron vialii]|uniref:phenylalanine--tRNA ligase beta subunit, cytoplasmic-like n=1 Tax=Rhododendron vialii TaxID=182163 RepID=UPI00265FA575|nr:phenylalanine--tRNA ligase beta subunit, cytoplasmic-like [Rhododendron vialii]XP_058213404.1 phenylalanine--tRNA ligase beta subunit, cytoplasmic-like [Rhododendron vialii]XP_058213413.1 phenylalanine--tRNA ligase beta subunit, cytoplasmic-like [Rhododendron vialii]
MPTISVGRDRLFEALGQTYSQEEFEDLCFKFGIELDDVTTEKAIIRKEKHLEEDSTEDEEVIYKIEVAANRYDLLCLEGLAQALRIFVGIDPIPKYTLRSIRSESMLKMHVKPETSLIRPYVVCAVLRGITFDEARYNSFIDLQDRLHQNICRRRTLVAIGTHDLDTIDGPFTYEALPPSDINFVPLKQVKNFRADELMEFYKSDLKLKKFLHIIENSSVYPVLCDCNRTVLSLPPIINGAHSAITLKTKNVFIECTATDLTKANVVLNTMVTMFSTYCERKFEVEPVEVIYSDGRSYVYPDISLYHMEVPLSYITDIVGVPLEENEVASLLNKMQLHAVKSLSEDKKCTFTVSVPPTRSDILHPCDVAEDVAIAYGYNEIPKRIPASLNPLPLNQFSDLIRSEIAMCGFTEVLTWVLCSYKEDFAMLNRRDDKSTAVIIGNPRSSDFEVVRTSLMPGMLKTIGHNKDHPKPIKIFEVGDIVLLDEMKDVGAANRRQLAALYCGATSGFELIHGLVDRVMEAIGCQFVQSGDNAGYYLERADEPEFLPGRQASIIYKGKRIGAFGIVHPEVLNNFDIPDACSFVELNIESFVQSQVS